MTTFCPLVLKDLRLLAYPKETKAQWHCGRWPWLWKNQTEGFRNSPRTRTFWALCSSETSILHGDSSMKSLTVFKEYHAPFTWLNLVKLLLCLFHLLFWWAEKLCISIPCQHLLMPFKWMDGWMDKETNGTFAKHTFVPIAAAEVNSPGFAIRDCMGSNPPDFNPCLRNIENCSGFKNKC